MTPYGHLIYMNLATGKGKGWERGKEKKDGQGMGKEYI